MASNPMTDLATKHQEPTTPYCAQCGMPLNLGLHHAHPDAGEPKLTPGTDGPLMPGTVPFSVKK